MISLRLATGKNAQLFVNLKEEAMGIMHGTSVEFYVNMLVQPYYSTLSNHLIILVIIITRLHL